MPVGGRERVVELCAGGFDRLGVGLVVFGGWGILLRGGGMAACCLREGWWRAEGWSCGWSEGGGYGGAGCSSLRGWRAVWRACYRWWRANVTVHIGYRTWSAWHIWCVALRHAGSVRSVVHSCPKARTISRIRWGRRLLAMSYRFRSWWCGGIVCEWRECSRIMWFSRVASPDR